MAQEVNYYTEYTLVNVTGTEIWGAQDVDGDGVGDGGTLPLEMKILPDPDYYVTASMFTMKGYEPTSIGPGGERIWEDEETTTDVNGDSVVVDLGNITKVEMIDTTNTASPYDPTNVYFPASLNPQDMCSSNIGVNPYTPVGLPFDTDICDGGNTTVFVNIVGDGIMLGSNPIASGDIIGIFKYALDGTYKCYGFIVWNDNTMPPAAITVFGLNSYNTMGFSEGDEMHVFVKQVSVDGDIFKVEPSWNDGAGWSNGLDGFNSEPYSFFNIIEFTNITNWSQNNLIFENNAVSVKAWLEPNYVIQNIDTELILDIDGDAVLIESNATDTTNNPEQITITLEMASSSSRSAYGAPDSNCIVHVFARTGYEYTSGSHTIPALPWNSGVMFGNDVYAEVVNIPETGVSGKASVTIQTTPVNSEGRVVSAKNPSFNNGHFGLGYLFCFIIEPLEGYSIHQGMVCPAHATGGPNNVLSSDDEYIMQTNPDAEDYVQTGTYGDSGELGTIQSMSQWQNWLDYEIYLGSPFSVIPENDGETRWWPGFSTQASAVHMTEEGTGGLQLEWGSSFSISHPPCISQGTVVGMTTEEWWNTGFFPIYYEWGSAPGTSNNSYSGERYFRPIWAGSVLGGADSGLSFLAYGGSFNPNHSTLNNPYGYSSNQGRPVIISNTAKPLTAGGSAWQSRNNYSGVLSNSYPDFYTSPYSNYEDVSDLSTFSTVDFSGNCVVVDLSNNLDDLQLSVSNLSEIFLTITGGAQPIEALAMPTGEFMFTLEEE
tara:strand:+ start:8632 stop:10938 length:2307 start_codon:yes stop_codon:yes gene_type:complete